MRGLFSFTVAGLALALGACGEAPSLDPDEGIGPTPTLPEPDYHFFTPVKIASVVGWAANDAPKGPVGVVIDRRGGLLVADDAGNAVWRVSGSASVPRQN